MTDSRRKMYSAVIRLPWVRTLWRRLGNQTPPFGTIVKRFRYFYLTPCVNGNFHCFLRQAYDILIVQNYHEIDLEKETP